MTPSRALLTWCLSWALSGLVWGLLLQQVLWWQASLALAVVSGPIIGVIVGWLVSRQRQTNGWAATARLALVGLYATASLFGIAIGIAGIEPQGAAEGWLSLVFLPLGQALLVCWGLTLSGLVLVFWPLAIANHLFMRRLHRNTESHGLSAR